MSTFFRSSDVDTIHTAARRALAAFVLAGAVGATAACGPAEPAPPASAASSVAASPASAPSPSPSAAAVGLSELPDAAFLTAADLGSGFKPIELEGGDGYGFALAVCEKNKQWDGKPEGAGPEEPMSAKNAREKVFSGPGKALVSQWTWGMRTAEAAQISVASQRAGFEHCGTVKVNSSSTYTFEILDNGFAGDDSVLVRYNKAHLIVVMRTGAAYTVLNLGGTTDAARAKAVAAKAAQRICDATPTC
ncbi:hypothetical protein CS0771_06770 [Catellatospora sp. IY07-71]|uniref:hypothetical protein n=1 Tax=Catellatospora sp. IY07-71 TaxID=2728827 RepID=UPI001BB3352C|nr:hypothetical protein [Catellatospora sp. IY07-71]BCJ71133.1 hypothetical protein CS0771_06770 [Catellatospora sp. IY07-71]